MKNYLIIALIILSGLCTAVFLPNQFLLIPYDEPMQPVAVLAGSSIDQIICGTPQTGDNCYDLSVDYTYTKSTETYTVESIPYSPYTNLSNTLNLGTVVNFQSTDVFSEPLEIFPFAFFDKTFDKIVIGENGVITFDSRQAGLLNLRYPDQNNPNADLTRNSIFAVQHDMIIFNDALADVYFKMEGTAPARRAIITYYNAGVFYCVDNRRSTIQIVLEELTNEIEVHILNKPIQCGINQESLLGIMDNEGLLGYSPPNRNTGIWETSNESWLFKPSGAREPIIRWYDQNYVAGSSDNNLLATGQDANLCITEDVTNFTVEVSYPTYRNSEGEIDPLLLFDEISLSDDYPVATDDVITACTDPVNLLDYTEFYVLNPNPAFNFSFFNTEQDAENNTNAIANPTNFDINGTDTLWVRVYTSPDCYDVSMIEISSLLDLFNLDLNVSSISICDNVSVGNDTGEELNLSVQDLNANFFNNLPANAEVYYYTSANANNPQSTFNITDGYQIWLEVVLPNTNGTSQCRTERYGPIEINLVPPATFDTLPSLVEIAVCDTDFDYREEILDINNQTSWLGLFQSQGLITSNPATDVIRVFSTFNDAVAGANEITNLNINVNGENYNEDDNSEAFVYYLRVENGSGCYTIEPVQVKLRFYGVKAVNSNVNNICFDGTEDIPVDLSCWVYPPADSGITSLFTEIYSIEDGTRSSDIGDLEDITYHLTISDAQNGEGAINPNQIITQDGLVENIDFFVRFTLCYGCGQADKDCFTVKRIRFRLINPEPSNSVLTVCSSTGGPTEVSDMNYFNSQLFDNPNLFNVSYYATQSDAQNQTNPITNYTFTGGEQLWVYITSNVRLINNECFTQDAALCYGIHPITFTLEVTPGDNEVHPIVLENICDNNADFQESIDLTEYIYLVDQAYDEITWFQNYNPNTGTFSNEITAPQDFIVDAPDGSITLSIYARLNFDNELCYNIVEFPISLSFKPAILLEKNFLCSCLSSASEYANFNLTDGTQDMFLSQNGNNDYYFEDMVISYHLTNENAVDNINEIPNPENYSSVRGLQDIYVRFYSPSTQCYSIEVLQLRNLVLPIPIPGTYAACDENFNNKPDLVLSELNEVVMPNNTIGYTFSYYLNLEDAENGNNSLLNNPNPDNPSDYFYDFNTLPSRIYVRVDTDSDECSGISLQGTECMGIEEVEITFGDEIPFNTLVFDLEERCDTNTANLLPTDPSYNDGIVEGIDLTEIEDEIYNAQQGSTTIAGLYYYDSMDAVQADPYPFGFNIINNPNNYTNVATDGTAIETIYVKAYTDDGLCSNLLEVNLNVIPAPYLILDEEYYLCPDGRIDILPELPTGTLEEDFDYMWTLPDGSIVNTLNLYDLDQTGLLYVQVTDLATGCLSTEIPVIVSAVEPPVIRELKVTDFNTVTVIASGFIDYPIEYSINGTDWQNSNVFLDLPIGVSTFYVRYQYNNRTCLGTPKETLILNIKNIITPNQDGINDTWVIDYLDVFGEDLTKVQIFDRYGKEIYQQESNNRIEWNGYYEGRPLNTTDYWYILTLPDSRQFKGNITVKLK